MFKLLSADFGKHLSKASRGVVAVNFCVGKPDGFYPNYRDCGRFYRCVYAGKTYPFTCPSGLWFDPSRGVCNWKTQIPAVFLALC